MILESGGINYIMQDIIDRVYKEIYNLNSGGCVKFAYLLSEELLKRNIEFTLHLIDPISNIRTRYRYKNSYIKCKKELKDYNKNQFRLSSVHVYIEVNNIYYNEDDFIYSKRTHIKIKSKEKLLRTIMEDFKTTYKTKNIWNDWYDRSQNKKLKQIILSEFLKFDKQMAKKFLK